MGLAGGGWCAGWWGGRGGREVDVWMVGEWCELAKRQRLRRRRNRMCFCRVRDVVNACYRGLLSES